MFKVNISRGKFDNKQHITLTQTTIPHLEMLSNKPRFKCWKQKWSGNASQNTAQHQDSVLRGMLGDAAQDVGYTVSHTSPLTAPDFRVRNMRY